MLKCRTNVVDEVTFKKWFSELFGFSPEFHETDEEPQKEETKWFEVTPVRGYENLPIFIKTETASEEKIQDGVKTMLPPVTRSYKTCEEYIKEYPAYLMAIVNPPKELIDVAVKLYPPLYAFLDNPTKEQLIQAVKNNIHCLKSVNPSMIDTEVIETAVIINGDAIQYAPKQTKKLQELALKSNPLSIRFMKETTAEMKLQAVKANPECIKYL